jgi:PAS domain S-box-containing protein
MQRNTGITVLLILAVFLGMLIIEGKKAAKAYRDLEEERSSFNAGFVVKIKWRYVDNQRQFEDVSANVSTQFGYNAKDLVTGFIKYEEIVHPDDRQQIAMKLLELTGSGSSWLEQEYRLAAADGQYRLVRECIFVIRDTRDKGILYNGYIIDVTGRKLLEDELKAKIVELDQCNKFAVDREMRLLELQEKIRSIEKKPQA